MRLPELRVGVVVVALLAPVVGVAPVAAEEGGAAAADQTLAIKGAALERTVEVKGGRIRTTALTDIASGAPVAKAFGPEFTLRLEREGKTFDLTSDEFRVTAVADNQVPSTPDVTRKGKRRSASTTHVVCAHLEGRVGEAPVGALLYYMADPAGGPVVEKSLVLRPGGPADVRLRGVVLEDLTVADDLRPEITDLDAGRWNPCVLSPAASRDRGVFWFMPSVLGSEPYDPDARRLRLVQEDCVRLAEGFTSARAALGAWRGVPDLGAKRFREYLRDTFWCGRGKRCPIEYETWLVEEKYGGDHKPPRVNEAQCVEILDFMKDGGFFTTLHIDCGWEHGLPLAVDEKKFPHGIEWLGREAAGRGFTMEYWFSPNYWYRYWSLLDKLPEHREWFTNDDPIAKNPLCLASSYMDYVEDRLSEIVRTANVEMLYMDGGGWDDPPPCRAPGHWHSRECPDLRVAVRKRFARMFDRLHRDKPGLIIATCTRPADIHTLGAADQQELSDDFDADFMEGVLHLRQHHWRNGRMQPIYSLNGSWYGFANAKFRDRTMEEYRYATLAAIASSPQIQGTIWWEKMEPERVKELVAFLRKAFAWRKRAEPYLAEYQRILGEPDGTSVDGEGHIVGGKGWLLLHNPTKEAKAADLPLDAPELELDPAASVELADWSDLETGKPLGKAKPGEKVSVTVPPVSVTIVSVGNP